MTLTSMAGSVGEKTITDKSSWEVVITDKSSWEGCTN